MQTIEELFEKSYFCDVEKVALFRCKKGEKFQSSYARNIKWISKGWTGWWPISDSQIFQGIVIMLDSLESNSIEIWAGKILPPNSGRFERRSRDNLWKLNVDFPFELAGLIQRGSVEKFAGQQIGNTVTYIERKTLRKREKEPKSHRGFSPEFSGDKEEIKPGAYTPNSDHGKLMTEFHNWLKIKEFTSLDNQNGPWDLHGFGPDNNPHLFEAKTDCSTSSIYKLVGQLNVYELDTGKSFKWAVLPSGLETMSKWKDKLMRLDIGLITYDKTNGTFLETEGHFSLDKGRMI